MPNDFPAAGMELTHILVTNNFEKSKHFYADILGAELFREYGGSSAVFNFLGSWLLIVTGGGPTEDKPEITFAAPQEINSVSHAMTIRVPDCQKAYEILKSRGAEFITPPVDWGAEIRCFFRDPDGHLLEISQSI
ncbi:MAG: VOC family protein [bacterium]